MHLKLHGNFTFSDEKDQYFQASYPSSCVNQRSEELYRNSDSEMFFYTEHAKMEIVDSPFKSEITKLLVKKQLRIYNYHRKPHGIRCVNYKIIISLNLC